MAEERKPDEILNAILAGSEDKSIPELLKEMPNEKLIKSFYYMESIPEVTQMRVLQDILKSAQNSEFGKKMGFAELKSVDDFRNKLPISDYSQVEAEIEKLKAGTGDILFDGATASFIATSGSTGIPKLIPESKNGQLVKGLVSQIRAILVDAGPRSDGSGQKGAGHCQPLGVRQNGRGHRDWLSFRSGGQRYANRDAKKNGATAGNDDGQRSEQ